MWKHVLTSGICANLLIAPVVAKADPIPPLYVFGDLAVDSASQCNLTMTASVSAAEAALRFNRVQVASETDFFGNKALAIYLKLNAFEIKRVGSVGTGSCAVSLSLELGTYSGTYDPVARNSKYGKLVYCENSTLIVIEKMQAQNSVNDSIMEYVNECISTYSKIKVMN